MYIVLNLERNNPMHQYRQDFCRKKNLAVLGVKLNMSWKCNLKEKKANIILGCIRQILPAD